MKENLRKNRLFFWGLLCGILGYALVDFLGRPFLLRVQLASENAKVFYTLGQLYARRAESIRLTDSEAGIVGRGFQDWAGSRRERVDFESHRQQLSAFLEKRQAGAIAAAEEEGLQYLKKFLKSGGLHSLSGLAYRIVAPGSQKKPTLKDWVQVSYRGTLVNGNVLDDSSLSGGKVNLPMNGVILGWTEGLQLIGEGGEIELVIPPNLGYGNEGTRGGVTEVPAGATLVFRIRLHKVLEDGRKDQRKR